MTDAKVRRVADPAYAVGSEVVAVRAGRGWRVRGYEQVRFWKGDRLIVRSVTDTGLRVRHPGGPIFRVDARMVEPVEGSRFRFLGDAPEGAIRADDPRLDWLWQDAAKLATATGHCREYDALCEALGIPGRVRSHVVRIEITPGVELRGRVRARSSAEAEAVLIEQVRNARPAALAIEAAS